MFRIKKKDTVIALAGKDRGKKGEVKELEPQKGRVVVSGVNIVSKHARPTQTKPGGVQKVEAAMAISNVALVCPKCNQPVRPKIDHLATGEKIRLCRKCGEVIL